LSESPEAGVEIKPDTRFVPIDHVRLQELRTADAEAHDHMPFAIWASFVAIPIASARMVTWINYLSTRPPCAPAFVGLSDIEQAAPVVCGAIALFSVCA
jgi:hypothetical protein